MFELNQIKNLRAIHSHDADCHEFYHAALRHDNNNCYLAASQSLFSMPKPIDTSMNCDTFFNCYAARYFNFYLFSHHSQNKSLYKDRGLLISMMFSDFIIENTIFGEDGSELYLNKVLSKQTIHESAIKLEKNGILELNISKTEQILASSTSQATKEFEETIGTNKKVINRVSVNRKLELIMQNIEHSVFQLPS